VLLIHTAFTLWQWRVKHAHICNSRVRYLTMMTSADKTIYWYQSLHFFCCQWMIQRWTITTRLPKTTSKYILINLCSHVSTDHVVNCRTYWACYHIHVTWYWQTRFIIYFYNHKNNWHVYKLFYVIFCVVIYWHKTGVFGQIGSTIYLLCNLMASVDSKACNLWTKDIWPTWAVCLLLPHGLCCCKMSSAKDTE